VPSNRVISRRDGDDVHMFTINAGSHVHVGISPEEAVKAVNVLCGFSAGRIALPAHSNVWRGRTDGYKSVAEMLWDWWKPAEGRCGLPPRPFDDLEDYVDTISGLRPIYVKRDGRPVVLKGYSSFADYFGCSEASGLDLEGQKQPLVPETCDIDLHNSCYWYTARISRYFTVENRVFDQQPPEDLLCTAALTLGLVSALDEAWEELSSFDWNDLRNGRERACREGLSGTVDSTSLVDFGSRMVEVAGRGLERRGRGEAQFLEPLRSRLADERCPADDVADMFREGGVNAVVEARAL
jgi:gamma-glutamylcysteine synthetase